MLRRDGGGGRGEDTGIASVSGPARHGKNSQSLFPLLGTLLPFPRRILLRPPCSQAVAHLNGTETSPLSLFRRSQRFAARVLSESLVGAATTNAHRGSMGVGTTTMSIKCVGLLAPTGYPFYFIFPQSPKKKKHHGASSEIPITYTSTSICTSGFSTTPTTTIIRSWFILKILNS